MVVQLLDLLQIVAILSYASGCDNTPECVIIENPKTSVIKYNDTAVVTCGIIDYEDTFALTLMIFDNSFTNFEVSRLEKREITNTNCDQDTKLCTATVLGNDMNNGIEIYCIVGGCCTESSFTYVVDGIPDPPDPPVVTFINTMSLNISWSSPWNSSRIPVNNYTLIITDNNTGIQDTIITTDTYYIIKKQDNVSCEDVYLVTVSANTDLGETNKSNSSSASFLSDIDDLLAVNYSFIDTYSIYRCGAKEPTYQVNGINPDLCPHETLQYSFSPSVPKSQSKNGDNPPLIIVPNATVPVFYFQNGSGVCEDGVCSVWETVIVNQVNDTRLVIDKFDSSSADETIEIKDVIHPVTTVALINTNATFLCMGGDYNEINATTMVPIINGVPHNSSMDDELEHYVQYSEDGYNITITASEENNNTRVQCFILPCFTEEAVLIVVESPPDPVDPPVTIINNYTSILITWSPPWVHPVNVYYVIVTDIAKERNVLIGNYSVKGTHYYLNTSGFECSILSVTVQADTDVDTTDPSIATTIPVYKGLKNSHVIDSTKTYTYTKGNDAMPPSLTISFESPSVCDHEVLTYQFKLKDLLPPFNEVVHNSGGNSSAVIELSSYLFHDNVLMVSVEVNVSDGYTSMIIPLYDNITMTETPSTNSGTSKGSPIPVVIVVVICVIMAVIIIFLMLVLCLSCYWYRRLMKAKRSRIVDTVIGDSGFNFSLPPMVVNAQYSTAEDVLYETIHDMTIEPYDTVAPRLPPPRPLSQKLADMSYNEEQEFESQLTSKKLDGEYIQMNGTKKADSPRYVKGPSLANSLSKTSEAIVPTVTQDDDNETIATTAFTFEPIEDNPT